MNDKSRWFAYIIREAEEDCAAHLRLARAVNAEIYYHGGDFPHWHCLIYTRTPTTLEGMKRSLGRTNDESFLIPQKPDATRRYMRNGGIKV